MKLQWETLKMKHKQDIEQMQIREKRQRLELGAMKTIHQQQMDEMKLQFVNLDVNAGIFFIFKQY